MKHSLKTGPVCIFRSGICLAILIIALAATMVGLGGCDSSEKPEDQANSSQGIVGIPAKENPFIVNVNQSQPDRPRITITHRSRPEKILWETIPGVPFVTAAAAEETITEVRGSFRIEDTLINHCDKQHIDSVTIDENRGVTILGRLQGDGSNIGFSLKFEAVSTNQLAFEVQLLDAPAEYNRIFFNYRSDPDEHFFGFGAQYSYLDMKGRKLPILTQEQGHGRGDEPTTSVVKFFSDGSQGSWYSTYAAVPYYITSRGRGLFLENYEVSIFDMEDENEVAIKLFGSHMKGRILNGDTPLDLIEQYTAFTGRMAALPEWMNTGAIVGMQGGTEEVYAKLALLQAFDTPVGGFWLQDWVGKRTTLVGSQLWWNWVLDGEHYPGWDEMVQTLNSQGIHVMTYVNPMLVDMEARGTYERNLYQEALQRGYLVKNHLGEPYMLTNTSFDAGLVDLTNPQAYQWFKKVLKEEVLGVGVSGWMADYAEAMPFDGVLYSGEKGAIVHNRYPEDWVRLNREVIQEAGKEGEVVFFSRSGYTRSPGLATLFFLGDHMVNFGEHDGMKSAIKGMLSCGISGYSLTHSDIGGYVTALFFINRTKEVFKRWAEANAFTAVFRTHEGTQPEWNTQFYTDNDTMAFFTRFAKVFRALSFYREELMQEAAQKGYPLARHPFLHYPDDPEVLGLTYQWMLGADFMIVPVVDPGQSEVEAYLPAGQWVHIWSGEEYGEPERGNYYTVPAPIGQPAVFFKLGSLAGERFCDNLRAEGLLP